MRDETDDCVEYEPGMFKNDSSMPAGEIIEALSGPCSDALCVRCGSRWGDHGAGSYDARCPDHLGRSWERTHFAPAVDPDVMRLTDAVAALRAERDAALVQAGCATAGREKAEAERDELAEVARLALSVASDGMQEFGYQRQQAEAHKDEGVTGTYAKAEKDAYRLFDAAWDALKMGPRKDRHAG